MLHTNKQSASALCFNALIRFYAQAFLQADRACIRFFDAAKYASEDNLCKTCFHFFCDARLHKTKNQIITPKGFLVQLHGFGTNMVKYQLREMEQMILIHKDGRNESGYHFLSTTKKTLLEKAGF